MYLYVCTVGGKRCECDITWKQQVARWGDIGTSVLYESSTTATLADTCNEWLFPLSQAWHGQDGQGDIPNIHPKGMQLLASLRYIDGHHGHHGHSATSLSDVNSGQFDRRLLDPYFSFLHAGQQRNRISSERPLSVGVLWWFTRPATDLIGRWRL